mmetsp:Transcript_6750/g.13403  ORF Transcript_6750/g.13403 Transcript_6750/m.13403 type:complete len:208 (-) Transcript_6750:775-1398(-)
MRRRKLRPRKPSNRRQKNPELMLPKNPTPSPKHRQPIPLWRKLHLMTAKIQPSQRPRKRTQKLKRVVLQRLKLTRHRNLLQRRRVMWPMAQRRPPGRRESPRGTHEKRLKAGSGIQRRTEARLHKKRISLAKPLLRRRLLLKPEPNLGQCVCETLKRVPKTLRNVLNQLLLLRLLPNLPNLLKKQQRSLHQENRNSVLPVSVAVEER